MLLKKVLGFSVWESGWVRMGGGWWGILFSRNSTPDRGLPLILPDDSVISYSGGPEYERVAFFQVWHRGQSEESKRMLQCVAM